MHTLASACRLCQEPDLEGIGGDEEAGVHQVEVTTVRDEERPATCSVEGCEQPAVCTVGYGQELERYVRLCEDHKQFWVACPRKPRTLVHWGRASPDRMTAAELRHWEGVVERGWPQAYPPFTWTDIGRFLSEIRRLRALIAAAFDREASSPTTAGRLLVDDASVDILVSEADAIRTENG